MEIISILGVAVSPYLVKKITDLFKKALTVSKTNERVAVIRVFVALASLGVGVANVWLTDGVLDPGVVQSAVESIGFALVTYYGASGIHLLNKSKN